MRTPEELEEYFKNFKEKRLKQKQLQRQKHQKQLQQLYKKVDETLKQEKKQKAEEIINSFKQTSAEPPKQTTITLNITIGEFYEENLYQTREELQEWERKHYPVINWDNWERIVQQTKQTLQLLL